MILIDNIRNRLASLAPRELAGGFVREAAVLMPIFKADGDYHFLLTRRTETVQTHKGQISFPGGMREVEETLQATALRETFEEVGIEADKIELLGRFHDYVSITEYRVTPFVGLLQTPFRTEMQIHEVAEILHVPFGVFLDPNNVRVEKNTWSERETEVLFYSYGTHRIWGLTARIIKDFFDALDLKP